MCMCVVCVMYDIVPVYVACVYVACVLYVLCMTLYIGMCMLHVCCMCVMYDIVHAYVYVCMLHVLHVCCMCYV